MDLDGDLYLYEIATGKQGFSYVYIFWNEKEWGALDKVKERYPQIPPNWFAIVNKIKVKKEYIFKISGEGIDF